MIKYTLLFIVFTDYLLVVNTVHNSQSHEDNLEKNKLNKPAILRNETAIGEAEQCVTISRNCADLPAECITCAYNHSCEYGKPNTVNCSVSELSVCSGEKTFTKEFVCQYCYQTHPSQHQCVLKGNCNAVAAPRLYYHTNCTVNDHVMCMGRRRFLKNVLCNWTQGYRWSTALILSVTLGGFGADRFYLGHWQEGIGKLFSFGGLGVWTLIDVILIALRYLGPADGSLYI